MMTRRCREKERERDRWKEGTSNKDKVGISRSQASQCEPVKDAKHHTLSVLTCPIDYFITTEATQYPWRMSNNCVFATHFQIPNKVTMN